MGVTCEKGEGLNVVRLEGAIEISSAAELKAILLETLAAGGDVRIDASQATWFDVTAMQLLWAAEREARTRGVGFGCGEEMPAPLRSGLREAGFEALPLFAKTISARGEQG